MYLGPGIVEDIDIATPHATIAIGDNQTISIQRGHG